MVSPVWVKPLYSKSQVDKAGEYFAKSSTGAAPLTVLSVGHALRVMDNWRSAHAYPLNAAQVTLRQRARGVDVAATVAQRIKRLPTILDKLKRHPGMQLSRMQDLGGARAVVTDIHAVRTLVKRYQAKSLRALEVVKCNDYISTPKLDGYRGIHLIAKYRSITPAAAPFDGMLIELQVRSRLQHAWGTAVETVGTLLDQQLKSDQGDGEWLRFFALASSVFAMVEGEPGTPGTPAALDELLPELRELTTKLSALSLLRGVSVALQVYPKTSARAFLLVLDHATRRIEIKPFHDMASAFEDYSAAELEASDRPSLQAVLVSVDSIEMLRTAYPNYFLDTSLFLDKLEEVLQIGVPR